MLAKHTLSRHFHEQLFEKLFEAAVVIDKDGNILQINPSFTRLLGYTQPAITEMRFADISIPKNQMERIEMSVKKNILSFELFYFNLAEKTPLSYTMISKTGKTIPVQLHSIINRNINGQIEEAIGLIIPDERASVQSLTCKEKSPPQQVWEMEQNYRNILNNSGDAIVITDFNGWIVTVNQAFLTMTGYENEKDIVARYLLELIPMDGTFKCSTGETFTVNAEHYNHHVQQVNTVFETGLVKTEGYMFKKDKTVFPIEATMSLLTDRVGSQRGTISICRDITDKIITDLKIKQSQDFFENIFSAAGDGLYVTDDRGYLKLVNNAFCKITGYNHQELIGKRVSEILLSVEDSPFTMEKYSDVLSEKYFNQFDSVWQKKDHTVFPVELKITVLKDSAGTFKGIVGSVRDITDRKQAEIKFKKAHDDLEIKIKERTLDLEEANTALRVLLKNREDEKLFSEKNILKNVNDLITPYIEKLQSMGLPSRHQTYLDILSENLKNIVSPFSDSHTTRNLLFTPMETKVANLVKNGKTTKEISEVLNLSTKTVEYHRNNIRKKLGIQNKKTSLRAYLSSSI